MKSKRQEELEAFLADDPNDPFLHYALALEYQKAGENDEYQFRLEWLVQEHQGYLATYYQLGKCYETTNKIKEASDIFKRGMALAELQKNKNTFNELKSALEELDL